MMPSFSLLVSSNPMEDIDKSLSKNQLYNKFIELRNNVIRYNDYSDMIRFVHRNITRLLSSAISKDSVSLQIVTDDYFLLGMINGNIILDKEYTNRFNRVYRSYIIRPEKNIIYNQATANLMWTICYNLNRQSINDLLSIGLDINTALLLIINRFSSTDERINIRRMVRTIQHLSPSIMTENMIMNIFYKTFNDQLSNLFISIMTDKFDTFYTENEKYVYSTVSNAILHILSSMQDEEIQDILHEYYSEIKKMGITGRFDLRSISQSDYKPIFQAIEYLEAMGVNI